MGVIFRVCNTCGCEKKLEDFAKGCGYLGHRAKCKQCTNEVVRKNYNKTKDVLNSKRNDRIQANKKRLKEYLGGELVCTHCDYTHDSFTPFDFHHLDPTTKESNPSALYNSAWVTLKEEIDKCVLLCKNCHALEHERLRNDLCI